MFGYAPVNPVNDGNNEQIVEMPNSQETDQLILKYKAALESQCTTLPPALSGIIKNFIDLINIRLAAITSAGATNETTLKDLICVFDILTAFSTSNIVNLHDRMMTNYNAANNRNAVGIPGAVSGFGGAVALGILFFTTSVMSGGTLLAAAAISLVVGTYGTAVVVDGNRKRSTVAECMEDILNFILFSFLANKKYSEYACAKLSIILFDAQKKNPKANRDYAINAAIKLISDENMIDNIITVLSELKVNLFNISYTSASATRVDAVILDFNRLKEAANKILAENSTNADLSSPQGCPRPIN